MSPTQKHQRWFPLESNPSLINDYVQKLGFDTTSTTSYEFVDVFSTEDWALQMIPQPVAAVLVLYPLTDRQLAHSDRDKEKPADEVPHVWFIKQRIGAYSYSYSLDRLKGRSSRVLESFRAPLT